MTVGQGTPVQPLAVAAPGTASVTDPTIGLLPADRYRCEIIAELICTTCDPRNLFMGFDARANAISIWLHGIGRMRHIAELVT